MCGIAGFVGKAEFDKNEVLKRMTDKIAHRGPDQEGMYVNEDVALGFRRLSIIDLDHGSQPMFNENKDIAIVFNGEIYNHLEIREELIKKGHVFANNADTEVLVHGYEEYGVDLLHHLMIQRRKWYLVLEIILVLSHYTMHRQKMLLYLVLKSRVY